MGSGAPCPAEFSIGPHVLLYPLGSPGWLWGCWMCLWAGCWLFPEAAVRGPGSSLWQWHTSECCDFSPRREKLLWLNAGTSPAWCLPHFSSVLYCRADLIAMDTRKIESRICAHGLVFKCLRKSGRMSCRGVKRRALRFRQKFCRDWVCCLLGCRNSAIGSPGFPMQFTTHFLL